MPLTNKQKCVELTLCILKPHVCAVPTVKRDVQRTILNSGFYVVETKSSVISEKEASAFYKEHEKKFFYNRLVTFMCSGISVFHVLAKQNAIEEWRNLLGPTKVYKTVFSHPDSIRGLHGLSDTRNAAHGSDSMESAVREIKIFFPELDATEWLTKWSENVSNGKLHWRPDLCRHLLI